MSRNGLGVRFRSGARTLSGKRRKEKREKGSGPGAKISRLRGVRPLVPERDGTSLLGEPNYWIWRRTVPPDRLIDFLTPTRPLPGGQGSCESSSSFEKGMLHICGRFIAYIYIHACPL